MTLDDIHKATEFEHDDCSRNTSSYDHLYPIMYEGKGVVGLALENRWMKSLQKVVSEMIRE